MAVDVKKLVVLLRSPSNPENEDKYHKALSMKGFNAVSLPVLAFEFHNIEKLADYISHPELHSGIIVTSQRSVEALELAVSNISQSKWSTNLQNQWQNLHLFVVGEATFKLMSDKLGLTCTGRESGSAESLVPLIVEAMKGNSKPLLFPCGNLAKETIATEMKKAGIDLQNVQVYRTCAHPEIKQALLQTIQTKGTPSVIVFFSPSGLEYSLDILKEVMENFAAVMLVAIGNTTQGALIDKSLPVAGVSKKPNPDCLSQCIEGCFSTNQ